MAKPKVNVQGRAVIEFDAENRCYLIMTPDGMVSSRKTKSVALSVVKKWARDNQDENAINVVTVEWRNLPALLKSQTTTIAGAKDYWPND